MARNRVISPEFWLDEEIATISPSARLLYIGLWSICDDNNATFPNRPEWIKAQVFPYNSMNVAQLLKEIEGIGKIIRFNTEAGEFWYIKNLLKHQKIDHPSKEKYPRFDESSVIPRESSESPQEPLDLNRIEVNRKEKNYSVRSENAKWVDSFFQEIGDFKDKTGEKMPMIPKERQIYPKKLREKYILEDIKAALYWAYNLHNKKGDYYWRGKITLPNLFYKILPAYLEEKERSAGKKKLEEMKAGVANQKILK